tara:strand:- start:15 stop:674 length:660 start_codon:yes stop_codon:yes gene_type:complete
MNMQTKISSGIAMFKECGYCIVNNSLSEDTLNIVKQYAFFDELQNYGKKPLKDSVPNAYNKYADPIMETLLLHLQPIVEQNTGMKLLPTYSYYRIYRDGDELPNHRDRPACEISMSVCLGYEFKNGYKWPIYVGNKAIEQDPADILVYKGCELYHRRDKLILNDSEAWQVQGFFHYVDAEGPYVNESRDKRPSIGLIKEPTNDALQLAMAISAIKPPYD